MKTISILVPFALVGLRIVDAAPVQAAVCNAHAFNTSVYYSTSVRVGLSYISPKAGQTITATLVDLATCTPYVDTSDGPVNVTYTQGTVQDTMRLYQPGALATTKAGPGVGTISFVAEVPDGAREPYLTASVGLEFTPGGLDNYHWVTENLGIVYDMV